MHDSFVVGTDVGKENIAPPGVQVLKVRAESSLLLLRELDPLFRATIRASAAPMPRSRAGDSTLFSARRFPRASAAPTPRSRAGARARHRRPGWSPCGHASGRRRRSGRRVTRNETSAMLTQSKFIAYSVTILVYAFSSWPKTFRQHAQQTGVDVSRTAIDGSPGSVRAHAHAVVDGSPGPVHADAEAKTPVASRARNPQRGDSARRSEEKTPTPSAWTRTKGHRDDLDSARARRSEKKTGASAGSPGPARADARAEIDGSRLKHKYTTLKEIDDPVLTKAYRAYKEWNVNELRRRLPNLLYADKQVNFYFAKHCRGVVKMHYPPFSECGPKTNLCLNVHKSRTAKEGRNIFKLKSSCMQLGIYSIAHWLVPDEEKYDYEEIRVSGVSGADDDFSVFVDKRSALALDLDQVEMFPTFDDNKVNIREELTAEYGKQEADEYMKKAGELYAAFVRARQAQVLRDTDKKPPVYLWNVGRIDIGKSLGGAQLDVWNAWQRPFPARDVFPSYHPAFLIRGTPLAKLAAKIADDNVKAFAEAILPAEAFLPAGATASANAGRLVAAASASASASAIAAPPPPSPPPSPSTPIAARTRPGFWEGIHGVANMTEKKREELRRDVLAHYQGMCDKFRDMIDAVELVENLERPATEEEQNAHDAALPSVQKWRDGRDKWRDMIDAVELVENLERPATEEEQNAHDAALPSVQKWRDGRDKWRDMIDAVELVENLVSAGIEPSVEQQNAHDDALPAVRRQRAGPRERLRQDERHERRRQARREL
jgi:hypothetical protein